MFRTIGDMKCICLYIDKLHHTFSFVSYGLGFFFLPTVKGFPSPVFEVSTGSLGGRRNSCVSSATGISTVTVSSASGLLRFV